jgi:SMP-30/Gluconolactonase/LRE-like region
MRRPIPRAAATVLFLPPLLLAAAAPAAAHDGDWEGRAGDLPATYTLFGDDTVPDSTFEGIAVDRDHPDAFYVTETTGGEIHRGRVDQPDTEVWLDEEAALRDGRRMAVGIAAHRDRVYVVGGQNRTLVGTADARDFWVYDDDGDLLAALRMPVDGDVFLNDVVVGPDGAAYVTDSTTPRIFRIAREHGDWTVTLWSDAGAEIPQDAGTFGLNGIEVAPDGRSLIVAHSANGELWRFDLRSAEPTLVDTGDANLTSSDGLVVKGRTLVAVRNAPHIVTYLRLAGDATSAQLVDEVATPDDRFLTTADVSRGRLLLVDSQFDEQPDPSQNSEVITLPFRR